MSILDASYAVFLLTKMIESENRYKIIQKRKLITGKFKEIDILIEKKCPIDLVSHEIQRIYLLNLLPNGVTYSENNALRRFFVNATALFLWNDG